MPLNIAIDNLTLDVLSTRLKNVVSPLDILTWLGNFEKEEVNMAIDFLTNLTVYTTNEIEEILNAGFLRLNTRLKEEQRIIVHPVGRFGKSGSMISYFFQKTEFYRKHRKRIILTPDLKSFFKNDKTQDILVLLDDFVGTGKTIEGYFLEKIANGADKFSEIVFIGIAGMKVGVQKIKHCFSETIIPKSNIFLKAFSNEASYFGYRKFYDHRDLAYKYGSLLTKAKKLKNGNEKHVHALGYENSQALVCFSYGSPNNTLPIIFSNGNDDIEWKPLIPRFSEDKVNTAKSFRKNILHELAILKEFGSDNVRKSFFSLKINKGRKTFSSVNHIDFSIYAIIKMVRNGFNSVSICQKLGILHDDYERYISIGRERGVFTEQNKMTQFGLELYYEAKKCIERRRRSLEIDSKENYILNAINYIPKKFNGRS